MERLDYSIYYRRWHSDDLQHYDDATKSYRRLLAPILPAIGKDAKILDIGCGQGLLVYALTKFGYANTEGVDTSAQQIACARKFDLNCRHVDEAYVPRLAVEAPGSYDAIFLFDVLEHLSKEGQQQLLKAICALLAPGGRFIISVPNANSTFASRWRYNDWTHEISFTESSLDFLLLNYGFEKIAYYPYEFIMRPRYLYLLSKAGLPWLLHKAFRAFRRLEAVAEIGEEGWSIPLSLNLLVTAQKPASGQ